MSDGRKKERCPYCQQFIHIKRMAWHVRAVHVENPTEVKAGGAAQHYVRDALSVMNGATPSQETVETVAEKVLRALSEGISEANRGG